MFRVGIRGNALHWFSSYLQGRRQFVEISAVNAAGHQMRHPSVVTAVNSGVPQGSILGPILFLIFINSLPQTVKNANVCLFADDTSLSLSSPSREQLEVNALLESNNLLQWFENNSLKVNSLKTHLIKFHLSQKSADSDLEFSVFLGDAEIHSSATVKFLGLTLDEKLSFHPHLENVCNKFSTGIYALRNLARMVGREVLLTAYYGLLHPHLVYAVPVWGAESRRTQFLFRLQKKAIRVVFSLRKRESCREYFRSFNILTFPSIFILETLCFVKQNFQLFSVFSKHNYNLRNNHKINIPPHSTSFFKRHLLYNGITIFNSLPAALGMEPDGARFKRQVKAYLIEKCYYSVQDFVAGGRNA